MAFRRLFALAATVLAATLLTGCFVVSKNVPAGKAVNDERLLGAWMAIEKDGDVRDNTAYLHFQVQEDAKKPLRLVWVEDKNYQVYELITVRVGNKNVFAATLIAPDEAKKQKDMPAGYFLGFYEVTGNEADFQMLDSQKVGALIESGKLKGIKPPGKYDFATLIGSPNELAQFLTSPAADAARVDDPARLRRVQPLKKN